MKIEWSRTTLIAALIIAYFNGIEVASAQKCCPDPVSKAKEPVDTSASTRDLAGKSPKPSKIVDVTKNSNAAVAAMTGMLDPAITIAPMQKSMDTANFTNITQASMSPDILKSYASLLNPNNRGLASPLDLRILQMLMTPLNPNLYTNWSMPHLVPANMNLMTAPLNPNQYTQWSDASVNPSAYGTWGQFINPASYGNMTSPFAGFILIPAIK